MYGPDFRVQITGDGKLIGLVLQSDDQELDRIPKVYAAGSTTVEDPVKRTWPMGYLEGNLTIVDGAGNSRYYSGQEDWAEGGYYFNSGYTTPPGGSNMPFAGILRYQGGKDGFAVLFRRIARRISQQASRALANVNNNIQEAVTGIGVAKNFRQEESIFKSFDESNQQSYRVNVQRGLVLSLVFPVLNALGGVFTAILVYVGAISITQGLITIGACATAGGIQAIRNWFDHEEIRHAVYADPQYVESLATSRPVADFVAVDAELRGCPISPNQLREFLVALVTGRRPQLPDEAVCLECKRRGVVCVAVARGIACLGPVTRTGCGAICPAYGRGCYGCFGPRGACGFGFGRAGSKSAPCLVRRRRRAARWRARRNATG